MIQCDLPPLLNLMCLRPFHEMMQQRRIGLLSVIGLASFVAEILQKILEQGIHGMALFSDRFHDMPAMFLGQIQNGRQQCQGRHHASSGSDGHD